MHGGNDVLYTESVTPTRLGTSEFDQDNSEWRDRINRLGTDIRELLARVEGMIEGIRNAIQSHKAA